MSVKVSVVVPVYNPGEHINDLIESMLRQSMPADEFEVIFADDESTDGSGARLDSLAAEHDNFSVIHNSPNSGWPGRPRNLGIDAARGEYILFVDNDDWIGAEALERMYDYARANDSDVLVGREVGHGRGIPVEIYRRNRPHAKLGEDPLLSMLTPHKMFRKSFLDAHGIRFPEGRRRLEDHVFVMKAFFAATVISVYADYPCYHWVRRPGQTNASSKRIDPAMYFGAVREVLDIVEANTEPGEFRDRLMSHWWGGKCLRWLDGRKMVNYPDEHRTELVATIRTLMDDRFPERLDTYLVARLRVRAALLRAGRDADLVTLAGAEDGVRAATVVDALRWDGDAIVLSFTAVVEYGDGSPVEVELSGDRALWRLPGALTGIPDDARDLRSAYASRRLEVIARNRTTQMEYVLPTTTQRTDTDTDTDADTAVRRVAFRGTAIIDPRTAYDGKRLLRTTDLSVRISMDGWRGGRIPVGDGPAAAEALEPREIDGRIVSAYATANGNLSLRVVAAETLAAETLGAQTLGAQTLVAQTVGAEVAAAEVAAAPKSGAPAPQSAPPAKQGPVRKPAVAPAPSRGLLRRAAKAGRDALKRR